MLVGAAGIVLMREHLARSEAMAPDSLLPEGKEAVFQYFTGEIFGRARSDNQRVLMLAALLPSVSPADAEILSGNAEAPLVLDYVYRRHLFTERRRLEQATARQRDELAHLSRVAMLGELSGSQILCSGVKPLRATARTAYG